MSAFATLGVAAAAIWNLSGHAEPSPPLAGRKFAAVYDIRDIIWAARHASSLPVGTSAGVLPGQYTKPPPPPPPISDADFYRQLIQLITDTVDSDSWTSNGGTFGRIGATDGRLYVVQTPKNQHVVDNLLQQLRDQMENHVYYARVYDLSDLQARDSNLPALVRARWQNESPPGLYDEQVQLIGSKLIAMETRPSHDRLQSLIRHFRQNETP